MAAHRAATSMSPFRHFSASPRITGKSRPALTRPSQQIPPTTSGSSPTSPALTDRSTCAPPTAVSYTIPRHVRQLPERTHDLLLGVQRVHVDLARRIDAPTIEPRMRTPHLPPSSPRPTSPASSPAQTRPSGTHTRPRSSIPSGQRPEAACKTRADPAPCCRSLSLNGFRPLNRQGPESAGSGAPARPASGPCCPSRISPGLALPRQTLRAPLCGREGPLESFRLFLGRRITRRFRAPLARLRLAPRRHRHDDSLQR